MLNACSPLTGVCCIFEKFQEAILDVASNSKPMYRGARDGAPLLAAPDRKQADAYLIAYVVAVFAFREALHHSPSPHSLVKWPAVLHAGISRACWLLPDWLV